MKIKEMQLKGVFIAEGKHKLLLTKNLAPGKKVYEERLIKDKKTEYREFDPYRSKLASSILNGISQIGIKEDYTILYLGAASGTTCSHVSEIVGAKGFVFALDFAPRVVRDLVFVCEDRKNIAPILADANKPDSYIDRVTLVDTIYQDIAQKNQAEIFLKNCKLFLKDGGFALIAVKARSIDVIGQPKRIFSEVRKKLEAELTVVDSCKLSPYQKDHMMFVCKKK